jgi:hypothetical protein
MIVRKLEEELKYLKELGNTQELILETENVISCTWSFTWSGECTCFFTSDTEAREFKRHLIDMYGNDRRLGRQYVWLGVIIGIVITLIFMELFQL